MRQKYGAIPLRWASKLIGKLKKTDKEEHGSMDNRDVTDAKPLENVKEITSASSLVAFAEKSESGIDLTHGDAQLLLEYMEGHDYMLGVYENKLVRGDVSDHSKGIVWEPYLLEDVIDIVCEWNYEFILDAEAKKSDPDLFVKTASLEEQLAELKKEEMLLDRLFDQTRYSKEIDELATKLADEVISIMSENKERLTDAVHGVVKEIHQVSGGGRSR